MISNNLLKYILICLIVGVLLKNFTDFNDQQVATYTLLSLVLIVGFKMFIRYKENMESVSTDFTPRNTLLFCNKPIISSLDEDEANSHIRFDHNLPKYPLLQHGQFEHDLQNKSMDSELIENPLKLDELPEKICQSKAHDLIQQHNHFKWTPHTHIGKARSYVNWKRFY